MNNFNLCVPTDIRFGKGQIECLPGELRKYGSRVLLVYGGGSIKRSGLYDKVIQLLGKSCSNNDGHSADNERRAFTIFELSGISPNPKISSVREGVKLCRENHVDVLLAIGGGSCIDASKAIAAGALYEGDPWDLVIDKTKANGALPVVDILTISATGSESNPGAVISNEETKEKLELNMPCLYPRLSICDPTYLYTLPAKQTAAGVADIIAHVFEQYFQPNDEAYITDRISEAVLKTCFHYGSIALKEPENYEARSNLMWAATLGLNHILTVGKGGAWSCHPIEHELSAFYDVTHGYGLAVITPAWMRYVLSSKTKDRFAMYAENVWEITEESLEESGAHTDGEVSGMNHTVHDNLDKRDFTMEIAKAGIEKTAEFFRSMGLPTKLSDMGIGDEHFSEMAIEAERISKIATRAYAHLTADDIVRIFEMCR